MNQSDACIAHLKNFTTLIDENLKPAVLPVHLAICIISSIVSVVNVIVLTRPAMIVSSTNLHLASLELSNLIVSVCYIPPTVLLHSFPTLMIKIECVAVVYVLMEIVWTSYHFSCWASTLVGVWRYVAIAWPLKAKTILTTRKAKILICVLTLACLAASAYDYWDLSVRIAGRRQLCETEDLDLLFSGFIISYNSNSTLSQIVLYCVPFELIPIIVSLVTTVCLLCKIAPLVRKCSIVDQCSFRKTYMLTILMVGFLISNLLHVAPFFMLYFGLKHWNHAWKFVLVTAMPTIAFNALTIILYYSMSRKFRDTFWNTFRCSKCIS